MLAGGTETLPGAFASELSAIVAGGPARAFGPNPVIDEVPEFEATMKPPNISLVIGGPVRLASIVAVNNRN